MLRGLPRVLGTAAATACAWSETRPRTPARAERSSPPPAALAWSETRTRPAGAERDSPPPPPPLPVFTAAEVEAHATDASMWVTYRGGVYDITSFLRAHPGGYDNIVQAAGGDVGAFYAYWAVHQQPLAQSTLARFRIGSLAKGDDEDLGGDDDDDPYASEPERDRGLRGLNESCSRNRPFEAEPYVLPATFETPNGLFYVRNHAPVPRLAADAHTVSVHLEDELLKSYTLAELRARFPQTAVGATLQCTGNRVYEMCSSLPRGAAVNKGWRNHGDVEGHLIGNATWEGVALSRLLRDTVAASARNPKSLDDYKVVEYVTWRDSLFDAPASATPACYCYSTTRTLPPLLRPTHSPRVPQVPRRGRVFHLGAPRGCAPGGPRGDRRDRNERRSAPAGPRRPGEAPPSGGRRRAQRQVAGEDRGAA
jgi:cytochrome b involved in lipid metabolism